MKKIFIYAFLIVFTGMSADAIVYINYFNKDVEFLVSIDQSKNPLYVKALMQQPASDKIIDKMIIWAYEKKNVKSIIINAQYKSDDNTTMISIPCLFEGRNFIEINPEEKFHTSEELMKYLDTLTIWFQQFPEKSGV